MRPLADRERIQRLLEALGRAARSDVRLYLVGGATAVLLGWRGTTIDVDFVVRPEDESLHRAIPALKEALQINVELASPADFIPVPPGCEDRGTFVARIGQVTCFHAGADRRGFQEGRKHTLREALALSPAERVRLAEELWSELAWGSWRVEPWTVSFDTFEEYERWRRRRGSAAGWDPGPGVPPGQRLPPAQCLAATAELREKLKATR